MQMSCREFAEIEQRQIREEDSSRQGQCRRDGWERRIPRVKGSVAERDGRGGFRASRAVQQRGMGEEDSARQGQCSRDGSERRIPRVKGSAAETDGRGEFPERRIPHLKAVPQRQIREEDSPPQWQCSRNGDSSDSKTAAPRGRRVRGDGMHADTHAVLRRDSSLMVYGSVS